MVFLTESNAAEDLDEDEQEQLLQCEQQVVGILLDDWRDELDIWARAYILEMISSGDIDMFAAAKRINLPEMQDEYEVVEQVIPRDAQRDCAPHKRQKGSVPVGIRGVGDPCAHPTYPCHLA